MVCVYCGSATKVTNSRRQRQGHAIWRRRQCLSCNAIFTSREQADLAESLRVQSSHDQKKLAPFRRDLLFVHLYESCKHRPTALGDAASLTQTVIDKLLSDSSSGVISTQQITAITLQTLKHFDAAAATFYAAYHPARA